MTSSATPAAECAGPEWVSGREAARMLGRRALSRRQARRVLDAGLAGAPMRTPSVTLYEKARVRDLVERREVPDDVLRAVCPHGVFVARRFFSVLAPRADQMEAVRGGFVALGANLTGFYKDASGAGLILRAPGSWYRAFERQRLSTWSGNAWQFLQERSWENQAP